MGTDIFHPEHPTTINITTTLNNNNNNIYLQFRAERDGGNDPLLFFALPVARSVSSPRLHLIIESSIISYAAIRTYTGHSDVCALGQEKKGGEGGVCVLRCTVYTFPIGPAITPFFVAPITAVVIGRYQTDCCRQSGSEKGIIFESDIPRPSHYIGWRQSTTNSWSVILI